jgi:hypothetical protein
LLRSCVAPAIGRGSPPAFGSDNVSVSLNTTPVRASTLSFTAPDTFSVGSQPYSVALADVNGDGRPDLITANFGSDTVSVFLNTTPVGASTPFRGRFFEEQVAQREPGCPPARA